MTRSIGPRDNDRVAYRSDGTATAQEAAVQLCTDAALQTPADVLTPGGAVIANSTVLVDELSRYPLVQYPEGVQDLYTRIADGPVVRLRARVSESSTGTVPPSTTTPLSGKADASVTISTTAPLTGGGDLSGNRALAVSDATSGAKGVLQLAGDLTGSAGAPAVAPGAVTSAKIADGAIVDGDVNASAAIGGAKLAHLSGVLSAVSRTVQDTLRERVSVFDVMTSAERADAVSGSPVLDHTAAFNTIIASCAAAGLREYYIPPGTYRVEGTIVGAANVWGSGPHAATPNAAASHSVRINHVPPSGS
ncbi:MAG TPA: hypothetical protein VF755_23500, partial [Catenuloplanes sp.]